MATVALAVSWIALLTFPPTTTLPIEMRTSGDWYRVRGTDGRVRLHTSHRLARCAVGVRGTRRIALRFAEDFHAVPTSHSGRIAWRLRGPGQDGKWRDGVVIADRIELATDLDPAADYQVEFETTAPPEIELALWFEPATPWFAPSGVAARGHEFVGFEVDGGARFLPPPAPSSAPWYVVVYGDSILDGFVPLVRGDDSKKDPRGARAHWARTIARRVAARMSPPRHAVVINHSFGGWWGCRLGVKSLGFETETDLRATQPLLLPRFETLTNRTDLIAPPFAMPRVDAVIYALGTNDPGADRFGQSKLYEDDIRRNIETLRTTWPKAKILMCSTHLNGFVHLLQRRFMQNACISARHESDPDLHFVDVYLALRRAKIKPLPYHPTAAGHATIAKIVEPELWNLVTGRTTSKR